MIALLRPRDGLVARPRGRDRRPRTTAEGLYDRVAELCSAVVIREYSSSFGLAARLLAEPVRSQVRTVYALVRVADEIVDNPDPSLARDTRSALLDGLLADVQQAQRSGWSANPVVHAFARVARAVGIGDAEVLPFFASMATDLDPVTHTPESFERYVFGSAEVVGLMCLRAFLAAPDGPADPAARFAALTPGARHLGAAFQKLNFLRDLADDADVLGRSYFPGLDPRTFDDADRDRILDDIDADLAAAAAVVPALPPSSRRAVRAAHATFAELGARLRATPAAELRRTRVGVPTTVKLRLAARALRGGA